MKWIHRYDLFLFDFDGLLVDTEQLHFQAYKNMCSKRGFELDWSFETYVKYAHQSSAILQEAIYNKFPELYLQQPDWRVLYQEKRNHLFSLVETTKVPLMSGVEVLLEELEKANILRCVVTHSPLEFIHKIREKHPALKSIPHWVTRENYTHPKPHPECYLHAIQTYGKQKSRVIGFEDSPRGLNALLKSNVTSVLIASQDSKELQEMRHRHPEIRFFTGFNLIPEDF